MKRKYMVILSVKGNREDHWPFQTLDEVAEFAKRKRWESFEVFPYKGKNPYGT